jgi:glucokinase
MYKPFIPIAFPIRDALPKGAVLLSADVGGTKTDIALFELQDGRMSMVKESVYPSRESSSLTEIVQVFNSQRSIPARMSIAFAGPVQGDTAKATNLDWCVDTKILSRELDIPEVFLLNDLEAEAYGLAALSEEDFIPIYEGDKIGFGNVAIVAPGTGLGEAGMFWDGTALRPFATEGGHTDFAPRTEFDWELLLYLQKQFGHVSWERVVSGPGIYQIYSFLREIKKWEEPPGIRERMKDKDPAVVIGMAAKEGCAICEASIRLFVRYLAIEASNFGLKIKATGGIFLGGGILPKIWNETLRAIFLEHYFQVGRLQALVKSMPVYLIMNPKTALLGAAYFGR